MDRLIADSFPRKENGRGGNRYLRKPGDRRRIGYQYNAPSVGTFRRSVRYVVHSRIISRSGYLNEELGAQPPAGAYIRMCTHI